MGNIVANVFIPEIRKPKCMQANFPEFQISVSPESSSSSSETEATLLSQNLNTNPGTLQDLSRECRSVQAATFEGAKILLVKNPLKNFKLIHSLCLGNYSANGYVLKATYSGKQKSKEADTDTEETNPIIETEYDPQGLFTANITNRFNSRLSCTIGTEIIDSTPPIFKFIADYFGDNYTGRLYLKTPEERYSNVNILGQYLRAITPNLAMGVELACELNCQKSRIENLLPVLSGRLKIGQSIFSGNMSNAGMQFCFYRPLSSYVSISFEYRKHYFPNVSLALLGYRLDLPQTDVVFKASVDTECSVSGLLEKRIPSLPYTFVFSSRLNHSESTFHLGFAVLID